MDELINEMYSTNSDFKRYVDKYMRKEEIDLETILVLRAADVEAAGAEGLLVLEVEV